MEPEDSQSSALQPETTIKRLKAEINREVAMLNNEQHILGVLHMVRALLEEERKEAHGNS